MVLVSKLARSSRELKFFVVASLSMGIAYSMIDATFNNFLDANFSLTGFQRSFLEVPRELPGFLVVFVSALLWFMCSRRLGAFSMLLGAAGALLIGFASSSFAIMVIWLFIYSMGQHMYMPLAASIGMELARDGHVGQRLGQLNGIRNFAIILGSFLVMIGFRYLNFSFSHTFLLAGLGFTVAALSLYGMKPDKTRSPKMFLQLHKPYRIFYLLAILTGSRKQIFITFAPWVLVTVFNQPTTILATLLMIGGIIGVLFQPVLGWAIDRIGERFILASEAVMLILICLGYGFSKSILPENIALSIVSACFIIDQMLMSVSMARSTYIKKIALQPDHVQPALTASVTIDHIFSISTALLGGFIWTAYGYQYVFLLGMLIAVVNFVTALQVRIPILQSQSQV